MSAGSVVSVRWVLIRATKKPLAWGGERLGRGADAAAQLAGRTSLARPPPVRHRAHRPSTMLDAGRFVKLQTRSCMPTTVILGAARTPFGRLGGALSSLSAPELAAVAGRGALERAGVSADDIGYVVMGEVLQAGVGMIPSRQVSAAVGAPRTVGSDTINKVCASGLRAVAYGDLQIRAGVHDVVLAGGMESMSNAPYLLTKGRFGYKM